MAIPKTHEVDIFNRALSRVGDARLVLEAEKTVTGITAASPPVVTSAGHGYANGDRVLLYDLTGGAELNGRVFEIGAVAATFALYRETGVGYVAASAGFCRRLPATKTARTVYDAWARIRDEIIRCHPWNSIVRRTRLARLDTTVTVTSFSQASITQIDNTTPILVHAAVPLLSTGDRVWISGSQAPLLNNRYFTVGAVGATFELVGTTASGAYGAGGVAGRNPPIFDTGVPHGCTPGDLVRLDDLSGLPEVNGRYFTVLQTLGATRIVLVEDAASITGAYVSGGTCRRVIPPLKPDFGYSYRYDLPEDCERVFELAEDPNYLWETEGRQVLTDLGPTVPIRYARKITDPDLFDSQLTTVLVARLAVEIAEELTQSNSKKQELKDDYEGLISEAKRVDAQEQSGQDFAEDDWVLARL